MHEPFWHYTDAQGTEHGPVTADAVRTAVAHGRIGPSSQFWREGMAAWGDLASVAGELGVAPGGAPADPYAAPRASVAAPTGFVPGGDVVPAGFVRRWVALAIDSIVLAIPIFVASMAMGIAMAATGQADAEPSPFFIIGLYLFYFVFAALYYALQESSVHQASLGKRAVGIKVVDRDGRRIGFKHAIGRWFAAAVSYMTFYIGFLMAAFTEKKTALHDLLSGTQVVDRWAYSEAPERQQRELTGCLVAAVVVMLLLPIAMVVLVFAVAAAQYQEYSQRAGAAIEAPASPTAAAADARLASLLDAAGAVLPRR